VYLTQTEMGSGGPSGSILTVIDGISALNPSAVVMVGIAFGIDESNQEIGDLLVSRQVLSYDLQRVGSQSGRRTVVLRGDRITASPRLLDRCRAAALDWTHCPVHFGLVMSGDKLVDNVRFRDDLVRLAGGEVVGGEMEGAGLYASAHRRKVDWILIKGICDWADGNKDLLLADRQRSAAKNAARFTSHLLGKGGFT
jgi:nucleoside phosphorylase